MEKIVIDYTNMMSESIGVHGINDDDFISVKGDIERAVKRITDKQLMFRRLPYENIDKIVEYGKYIRSNFKNFLVLGIGGSALGPKAIFKSTCGRYHNEYKIDKVPLPKFYFEDNVDPDRIYDLINTIDLENTCINIISKSGKTIETLSQMMIFIDALQKLKPDSWTDNLVFTTDKDNSVLLDIGKKYGIKMFYIPQEIGGRYSIFTPVGILTAAVCGCDIHSMLKGARDMNELCNNKDYTKNPAFMYAVLQYISMKRGKNISIMMPYTDSLKFVTDWFSQLWAESLGKKYDIDGNVVNAGQTPVRALGSVDQHSQLQLYMEGPFDKVVTLIKVDKHRYKMPIPTIFEDSSELKFLCNSSLNKLINSELEAIIYALTQNGRPNIVINLPSLDEYYLGQMFIMLEIATAFAGYMLNINPFDQPGVEHGKISTYALMGKEGFEERRKSLEITNKIKFLV